MIRRMTQRVGFIGLGIMGLPMAGHLLAAGRELTVYSRTRAKAEPLLGRGAQWASSPAEVAAQADVVFICVTDTPDVQQVIQGDDGIMRSARAGLIVVDHSTISPSVTKQMAGELATHDVKLLDAPVSGGDIGARNATLAIMVGGERTAFDHMRGLLEIMGKTITYCGESGSGQLTKLVNQILVSVTELAVCEALVFARSHGLDLDQTIQAVAGGAAGSWQLSNLGPKMAAGDYAPGFMIDLQQKDLGLVLEAAKEEGLSLHAVELVHRMFARAQADGHGRHGTAALFDAVQKTSQMAEG